MAEIFASSSSSVGASAAAGMSSQCPLQTEASWSQAAEIVKMTGFDMSAGAEPSSARSAGTFSRSREKVWSAASGGAGSADLATRANRQAALAAALARSKRLRSCGSRRIFLRRIDFGVTSTSSSSSI
jgi:hypothetical protein